MHPGGRRGVWIESLKTIFFALAVTAGFLLMMGEGRLSDDQINYIAIADRILDPSAPFVPWIPYRTFSFLIAGIFRLTHDHIISLKVIFSGITFAYVIGMSRLLSIFFKSKPVIWATTLISMTPGYTMGMTFWGFGAFELILARTMFMALAPWSLMFFWSEDPRRRIWGLLFCVFGALLSMEALLLLAAMLICLSLQVLTDRRVRGQLLGPLGLGIIVAIFFSSIIYFIPVIFHENTFFNLKPIYENLILANREWVEALSHSDYIDLFWRSAYSFGWWTLFPPRISDVVFMLANQIVLVVVAIAGWQILRRKNHASAGRMAAWCGCIIIAAYGYPLARYVGWKLFSMPPHIFEEVRVIKFIHPVLLVCAAALLDHLFKNRRHIIFTLVTAALCISPLSMMRVIPIDWKRGVYDSVSRVIQDSEKLGYVAKALSLHDPERYQELKEVKQILEHQVSPHAFVLSTEYLFRLSGRNVMVLYNDKRMGVQRINGVDYQMLPYWYVAYSEIASAIDACDEGRILELAIKYRCDYAALSCDLKGARWQAISQGKHIRLYRLTH